MRALLKWYGPSKNGISIGDLARKIIELSGKRIDVEYDLSGPQGTHRYSADTARMRDLLDWSPRISLQEGLKRTFEWARATLDVRD